MKNILKITVCCLVMMACESDDIHDTEICDTPDCIKYFEMWKSLLSEKNNIPISYIEKHMEPYKTEIHSWADGESFGILYYFHFDWLKASLRRESFIIRINEDDERYRTYNIPKGVYLSEFQILSIIEKEFYSSYLNTIALVEELKYNSEKEALKVMTDRYGKENMGLREFVILRKGSGYPLLHAVYWIDEEKEECKSIYLNLVTGDIEEKIHTVCHYD